MPAQPPKLLTRVRDFIRSRHMSPRTEQVYVAWIRRYVRYHSMRHPAELTDSDAVAFLTYLASEQRVARSTQIQALSAISLLYTHVLRQPLGDIRAVIRSNSPARLPVVLGRTEVRHLIEHLPEGDVALVGLLLYGSGLRLAECLSLRVKDATSSSSRFVFGEARARRIV